MILFKRNKGRIGMGAVGLTGLVIGLSLVVVGAKASDSIEKPNILFILADDVGREVLGCYGGESYATPQLDQLAERGMRFQHAYVMPVCHPTRVAFLTGRYPYRFDQPGWGSFPESAEEVTVAQTLRRGGYATAVAGKWQLTKLEDDPNHPQRLGFDQWCLYGWHEGPRYYQPLIWENGEKSTRDGYGPDIYCDFLRDFIVENRDRPFFAFYSMTLSHAVADDFDQPVPFAPGKDRYDSYREMVRAMDLRVGRMMDLLDRLDLERRTLVIFIGDNGTPGSVITDADDGELIREPVRSEWNGESLRGGKGTLKDAGTRVPMIAHWAGTIGRGEVVDDLVEISDFFPTFAELAGVALPDGVDPDGKSFVQRLRGAGEGPRDWVFVGRGDRYYVRDRRWKLYHNGELFDMRRDAQEANPIIGRPKTETARRAYRRLSSALDELNRGLEEQ